MSLMLDRVLIEYQPIYDVPSLTWPSSFLNLDLIMISINITSDPSQLGRSAEIVKIFTCLLPVAECM